jgi:hypothetical protein
MQGLALLLALDDTLELFQFLDQFFLGGFGLGLLMLKR